MRNEMKILFMHGVKNTDWFSDFISKMAKDYHLIDYNNIQLFLEGSKTHKNAVHLTFDDGDLDFYHNIFPLMRKRKIPFSIFVSPNSVKNGDNFWFQEITNYDNSKLKQVVCDVLNIQKEDLSGYSVKSALKTLPIDTIWEVINIYKQRFKENDKPRMNMNLSELNIVKESGLVTIGAHTQRHPILSNEDDSSSKKEIVNSINELSEILNESVKCFAYPNGVPGLDFSQREIDILSTTSSEISFSTLENKVKVNDNKHAIPRFGVPESNIKLLPIKFLLGQNWSLLKSKLKGKDEMQQRLEIKAKFFK